MQLSNTFAVSLPVDEAWKVFLDLERVAPCLPGAALTGVEGEEYQGGVKIKVGPVSAQYRGTARFVETDDDRHRAVIAAKGKDVGGQGNAEATIVATLAPQGEGTQVRVDTDLELSGRVAQFGRGVIGDVTGKLLAQFAKNLEAEIGATAAAGGRAAVAARPAPTLDEVEPLNVVGSMGPIIAKYAVPALGGLVALALGVALLRRAPAIGVQAPSAGLAGGVPQAPINIFLGLPAAAAVAALTSPGEGTAS